MDGSGILRGIGSFLMGTGAWAFIRGLHSAFAWAFIRGLQYRSDFRIMAFVAYCE